MKVLDQAIGKNYAIYNGDSCEVLKDLPDNSVHYSITSIPFASLYTYSATSRDTSLPPVDARTDAGFAAYPNAKGMRCANYL